MSRSLHSVEQLEVRRMLAASLSGSVLVITGTSGDDTIAVTQGTNISVNLNGATQNFKLGAVTKIRVEGGDGHDSIDLGADVTRRSTIIGGEGNDTLTGGNVTDIIKGGAGADRVRGGYGNDTIGGGTGDDNLAGQGGDDFIGGDADDDTLSGGSNDDLLYGGAGDDNLAGGNGNDTLGGDGEDRLNFWKSPYAPPLGGDDRLDGGAGNDWLLGSQETRDDQYDDDSAAKLINMDNGRDTLIGGTGDDILDARGDDTAPDKSAGDIVPEDTYHNNGIPIPPPGDDDPYHLHAHIVLRVIVDGKKVEFPVGVGEFGVTMIHRHYAEENGSPGMDEHKESWHLHALNPHTFTIKELFHVAGVSFSNKNLGRYRVGDGNTMTVRTRFLDESNTAFKNVTGTFGDYVIKATDIDGSNRTELIEIKFTSK